MNNNAADHALQRLLAINWENYNDSRHNSHVALMKEYLRRAALWSKALQITGTGAFFDIASHVVPDVRAPQHLVTQVNDLPVGLRTEQICTWYLHWAMIKDRPEVVAFNLPDPYEPLIRLYERRGSFTTEHGFVDVDSAGIYLGSWSNFTSLEPLPDLADAKLDRIDAGVAKPELVTS